MLSELTTVNDSEEEVEDDSSDKKTSKSPRRKKSAPNTDSLDMKPEDELDLGECMLVKILLSLFLFSGY